MRSLVTGGTGVLGSKVVGELLGRGLHPRVISRKSRSDSRVDFVQADLLQPASLPKALEGIQTVIHLASNPQKPQEDLEGTANLLQAAKATGVQHIVLISIVGIDNMSWMPYYRAKKQQEQLVTQSGIPYTILRAAQFHEFVASLIGALGRGQVQFLPDFTLQPVQTEAVAKHLVHAALSEPAGCLPDLVGPEPRNLMSLGKEYLAATGQHKTIIAIPLPSFISRLWQPIGGPNAERAGQSWTEWLAKNAQKPNVYRGAV